MLDGTGLIYALVEPVVFVVCSTMIYNQKENNHDVVFVEEDKYGKYGSIRFGGQIHGVSDFFLCSVACKTQSGEPRYWCPR